VAWRSCNESSKRYLTTEAQGREKKSIFRNPDQSYASVFFHSEKFTAQQLLDSNR
jgi:hypothetical protein